MTKSFHNFLCWLLLSFWLLISGVSLHAHICFDGQEPAVSIHLQITDSHESHENHHPLEVHDDQDVVLQKWVITKISKSDLFLPLLIAVISLVILLIRFRPFFSYFRFYFQSPSCTRPAVRAPPFFSA